MPPDRPPAWTLVDFGTRIDQWEQLEHPPPDLLIIVNAWVLDLMDDALVGKRMSGFPEGWRFAVIPGSHNGEHMVTCTFRVDEQSRIATCSYFGYQAPPFGPA